MDESLFTPQGLRALTECLATGKMSAKGWNTLRRELGILPPLDEPPKDKPKKPKKNMLDGL